MELEGIAISTGCLNQSQSRPAPSMVEDCNSVCADVVLSPDTSSCLRDFEIHLDMKTITLHCMILFI